MRCLGTAFRQLNLQHLSKIQNMPGLQHFFLLKKETQTKPQNLFL